MGEKLIEFLRLEKRKITVAILIPYVWNFMLYSILFAISLRENVIGLPTFGKFLFSLAAKAHIFLVESIIFYPSACATVVLYDKRLKGLREDKELYRLVKIGLLVFNPLSIEIATRSFLLILFLREYEKRAPQMGLTILEVYPNSPAEAMGLKGEKGRVIELIEYRRYGWVGNARTIIKNITKRNPSISDAKEILEYIDINNTFDELYIEIYLGGGYLEHPSSLPVGVRVRDAQGNEAIL